MAALPPWLDVTPQSLVAPAEAGARLRDEQFNSALSAGQQAQQKKMQAAQLGMEQQRMQQQAAEAGQQMQLEAQRQQAAAEASRQRLEMESQSAARKFQAQQKYQQTYQQLVNSGVDPSTASMQATFAVGPGEFSGGGTALSTAMRAGVPFTPRIVKIDGQDVLQTGPQKWQPMPQRKAAIPEDQKWGNTVKTESLKRLNDEHKATFKEYAGAILPADKTRYKASLDEIDAEIEKLTAAPTSTATAAPQAKIPKVFMGTQTGTDETGFPVGGGRQAAAGAGGGDSPLEQQAREAIAKGAPADKVNARLRQLMGYHGAGGDWGTPSLAPASAAPDPSDYQKIMARKKQDAIALWKAPSKWGSPEEENRHFRDQEISDTQAGIAQSNRANAEKEYRTIKARLLGSVNGTAPALDQDEYAKLYQRMKQIQPADQPFQPQGGDASVPGQ